jgi:NAD(P)-dependent dehydrogenase (short-subunit alcohol dehydrogenase family)
MSRATARFDLTGRHALVTGAVSGIGQAIALALAEHGAGVTVLDRVAEEAAAEVLAKLRDLGARPRYIRHDLRDTSALRPLTAELHAAAGPCDILVNNAGISTLSHFDEVTVERWREIMTVNAEATFFLSQAVAEHMITGGVAGRIVNVSSKNALVAEAGLAAYNASKAAVELLSQTLAIELGAYGITVNTIAPGIIETGMADDFPLDRERFQAYYREHIPLRGRFGGVDDCVGAVLLLVSDAGAYITGQRIVVDGGVLCSQVPRLQFMRPPAR